MKKILLTLCLVITTINAMSQINDFIIQVEEEHENMVYVYMNPYNYETLSDSEKTVLLKPQLEQRNATAICVICAHDVELWQLEGNILKKVDSWDKDSIKTISDKKQKDKRRSLQNPWFFNLSGVVSYYLGGMFDSDPSTLSYSTYCRLGCYLLKGRWDMACNCLIGYNKNGKDTEGSFNNSIGADTRIYLLKGKIINPFAGFGMAYAFGGDEPTITFPVSTGFSIPVKGKGCIEFNYQYNKATGGVFMAGYTYMHQ